MPVMDTLVGLYHFLGDRAPKNVPVVKPKPRKINPFHKDGRILVAKVKSGEDLKGALVKAVSLLGGLEKVIARGDKVLVKPNFNSPDPPPMSTDIAFLRSVTELLLEAGARVTIGESAGGIWRPTRNVFQKLGAYELAKSLGVELVAFEEDKKGWVKVEIDGDYLQSVTMPRLAYEADKLVYLPCMKTHFRGRYSGSMKLAMGFMHPGERRRMHLSHLEGKIAEISLCWQPDLIIMDGRKALVTGGPTAGQVVKPGIILASGDLVATDVEAVRIIMSYNAENRLLPDPWQLPQIFAALKHDIGAAKDEYIVIE